MAEPILAVLTILAALLIVLRLARIRLARIIIFEFQRGLRYSKGRFQAVLGPGQYWILLPATSITPVDIRPTFTSLVGQELLTGDGVPIKVSVAASYEVADPALAINGQSNYAAAFYLALQLVVREVVAASKLEELIENRAGFAEKLRALGEPQAKLLGLHLVNADLKDLMVSGELKKSFSQVVKAKKEGQAALERARGETAALRNLANAARMIQDNPNLMQLRVLQAFGESSGNTLVFGMPPSVLPLTASGKGSDGQGSDDLGSEE